jgi:hypothetical protein
MHKFLEGKTCNVWLGVGVGARELDIRLLLVMGFPLSYDRISIESCVSFVEALEPRSLLRSKARCQPSCLERLAELCYCVLNQFC